MENFLSHPVFDNFEYFKKYVFKTESRFIETYTHEDKTYTFNLRTIYFYHHYIDKFGFDYIEQKISKVKDDELKQNLNIYLEYSRNYKTASRHKIKDFIEEIGIKTRYLHDIRSYMPFDYTSDLEKVLTELKNDNRMEEITSILIAFYFVDMDAEDIGLSWFYFTQIFCKIYGNETGKKYADSVFNIANEYLEDYGQRELIPYSNHEYPIRLGENADLNTFVKNYQSLVSNIRHSKFEHIHIGKQTFYNMYMQIFPLYADLRNLHGPEFFSTCMQEKDPELTKRLKLFEYIYDNSYNEEQERFLDFLSMLDCEFLGEKLCSYVPVSSFTIESFINNNYSKGNREPFDKYLGILLTYWLYDEEDVSFATSLHIHNLLKQYLEKAEKHFKKTNRTYTTNANEIIKEVNLYGKILNLPLIRYAPLNTDKWPESGHQALPWKFIEFKERHVLLYHPNHYMEAMKEPYRLEMKNSKTSYNNIKLYFENVVPMLTVKFKKGKITNVDKDTILDLETYVSSILYRTSKDKVKIEIKPRRNELNKYKTYTKKEASSLAQISKSHYLEELCKMQLPAYKVYHFKEMRANVSSFTSEDIFCFILKESYNYLVAAIENTLDSRSTILFYIKKTELPHALDVINVFFASNTLNKRQSIQWKTVNFNDASILRYERIIHTSFWEWKGLINNYVR